MPANGNNIQKKDFIKKRVCHVISNVDRSFYFEALGDSLDKQKYEVSFLFLSAAEPYLYNFYKQRGYETGYIKYRGKKDFFRAIIKARKFLKQVKADIVHTHLTEGTLIGLIAAFTLGIKNRIHTRHHAAECHMYYRHAVWYDKFNNLMSKRIVANSNIVAGILTKMEKAPARKVRVIYYGYNFDNFSTTDEKVSKIRGTYKLSGSYPVIGVISRFVHWKGVQDIIPAFYKLLQKYPNSKLVLANAKGEYSAEILKLLKEYLPDENYVLIEYEKDVFSLYKTFDIFVHVPVNKNVEAFGQTYIESLLMEVPSVFTLSGIASEIAKDRNNAVVVPYSSPDAIYEAMLLLMDNPDLKKEIARKGRQDILDNFNASLSAKNLDQLYSSL